MVDRGLQRLLSFPTVYETFQTMCGARIFRNRILNQVFAPRNGERVLDIGCGTGAFFGLMRNVDVQYVGIDGNARYIQYARKKYGAFPNATFLAQLLDSVSAPQLGTFDLIMGMGLLHHLEDSQIADLTLLLRQCLRPQGRVITGDPCHFPDATYLERFFADHDRGKFVRTAEGYRRLLESAFPSVRPQIRIDSPFRMRGVFFECRNRPPAD